jgi:hypothetical protein
MPDMAQPDFDSLGAFRSIATEYGGSPQSIIAHIRKLENENRKLSEEKAALDSKLPTDKQIVLDKDKGKLLEEFEALGMKPADLKTAIEAGKKAIGDLALTQTKTAAAVFAKAAGISEDAVETLITIPQLTGAKFEVRKVKGKNATGADEVREVAYVTLAGENQTAMQFEDAQEKLPVLKGLARVAASTTTTSGASFVAQPSTSSSGVQSEKSALYDGIRDQVRKELGIATPTNGLAAPVVVNPLSTLSSRLGMGAAG